MSTLRSFHKCTVGMVFVALTVSGCAAWTGPTMPFDGAASLRHDPEQSVDRAADGRSRSQILMRSGIDYLYKNDLDKAQAVFNTALKFDFDNAQLHFLNALTYHQSYLRGDADSFELAKTGYRTAPMRCTAWRRRRPWTATSPRPTGRRANSTGCNGMIRICTGSRRSRRPWRSKRKRPAPGAPITPARPASTPTPFICARA